MEIKNLQKKFAANQGHLMDNYDAIIIVDDESNITDPIDHNYIVIIGLVIENKQKIISKQHFYKFKEKNKT